MEDLAVLTADLNVFCNKIFDKYRDKESLDFSQEHLFVHYLERLDANLNSIRILIIELDNNLKIEHSIGLILRSNLTDFFTISYISMGKMKSHKEWTDRICIVNYDQIKSLKKYMSDSLRNGWMTNEQYQFGLNRFENDYSFMKNLTDLDLDLDSNLNRLPGPQKIAEEMLKDSSFKILAKGYDILKYYAQYEHYGFITSVIQKVSFETDIDRIKQGLFYSLHSLIFIAMNLEFWDYMEEGKRLLKRFD